MAKEPQLKPSDVRRLRREAERLIAAGEMPSLEEFLSVVAEVRGKYRPKILATRSVPNGPLPGSTPDRSRRQI
jgi:hypothetical protein